MINRPILVTGSPRSRTSWVGRMIGNESYIHYVHEPFNITNYPCHCGVKFKYWFWYLFPENLQDFKRHLTHTIYPALTWIGLVNAGVKTIRSKRIRPLLSYFQSYFSRRVVVKGPMAVFSAETLADFFGMDVIVLIRHPAAIANSYKDLNWTHPFGHFLNQPELMEEHLAPFRHEIEDFANHEYDILDQAALLWKLIHYRISKYQKSQPNWTFARYEDLAMEPTEGFREIFNRVDLTFSKHAQTAVQAHNPRQTPSATGDPYSIRQNARKVMSKWREKLTSAEVARIRERVEDVSSVFYSEREW